MSDLFMFPGGTHSEQWLFADNCPQELKAFPCQVAGEYNRGDFTLGIPFVPTLTRRQKDAVEKITSADDYPVIIWLAALPQEHYTTAMALRVEPDISTDCAPTTCCKVSPDGLTFDVVEQEFNMETMEGIDAPEIIGDWDGLNATEYSFTQAESYDRRMATGIVRLVGIRLLTPPTGAPEKLACLVSRITPVIKVHNFDAPLQTM